MSLRISESIESIIGRMLTKTNDCEEILETNLDNLYYTAWNYEKRIEHAVINYIASFQFIQNFNLSEKYRVLRKIILADQNWEKFYPMKNQLEVPRWPMLVYILSAMICLGFSAIFHLGSPYSLKAKVFLAKMDYSGISILIMGSYYPSDILHFHCHSFLKLYTCL